MYQFATVDNMGSIFPFVFSMPTITNLPHPTVGVLSALTSFAYSPSASTMLPLPPDRQPSVIQRVAVVARALSGLTATAAIHVTVLVLRTLVCLCLRCIISAHLFCLLLAVCFVLCFLFL